jgi:KDO2-lipid IV(A) lauroyltransferase
MAKERSKVVDYLVYLAVRAVLCLLQALPYATACRLADGLAWLAYRINRRHRLVALENLGHAFGAAVSPEERDDMVRAVYRHFCTLLIEMAHLSRLLHPCSWHRYLRLVDGRHIVGGLLSGRPLLLVTGHFGNWEMAGYALGMFGFKTYAIARTLDNPYLNDFLLYRFRQRTGQTILNKSGDFDRIQNVLAGGGVVATLGDQDAGQRGPFVDFFGRAASTHRAIALLALQFDAPMLVVGAPRVADGLRYDVIVEEVIDPRDFKERSDAVLAMTQRFTSALERLIRRHPEQYFWLHRRWKHQPQKRKAKRAA